MERKYTLDIISTLRKVECEKDQGIIIDSRLSFSENIAKKTSLAKIMQAMILEKVNQP